MTRGVLVMAYGTPASLDDIEAYYTDIRGGRAPSAELLDELTGRYRAIGGRSPLLEITQAQAAGIEGRLTVESFVGMKHAVPTIADAVRAMKDAGIDEAVGLALAPHYSHMSIGDYDKRTRAATDALEWEAAFTMIPSWHLEPGFITLLAERVRASLDQITPSKRAETVVLFTAHSLPTSIIEAADPYPDQVLATAEAVAIAAGLAHWQIGWQSAGRTSIPWLGPDLLEIMVELAAKGTPAVIVCPCGFVADHLEVLYDVDIEARGLAVDLDMELVRTASPNDDPAFLDVLASVVGRAFTDLDR